MIVSAAIAIKDEADLASGHKRKKEGDILAIKYSNASWGRGTKANHLITKIDLGNSIATLNEAKKLLVPQFATEEIWWPSDGSKRPTIVGKCRYKIPFTDLDIEAKKQSVTIDFAQIGINYQPIEDTIFLFSDLLTDVVKVKKLEVTDLTDMRDVKTDGKPSIEAIK